MSNKKTRQSREVFLDFTMNDDNNLLEQINEVDRSFALNIPRGANKVKHTKVTMANNEDKGNIVNNMKKANLSIDLVGSTQMPNLDDLVKETEELIGTISETVQETAKISSQKIDLDLKAAAETMLTDKEELPNIMGENAYKETVFASPFDKLDEFPTIEQDLRESDVYTPHFIHEDLLQDTISQSESSIQTSPFMGETLSATDLFDDIFEDEESDILDQTGSFLFNAKDLHLFLQDDEDDKVAEFSRQVDITQTIPETEMPKISEISQKISELEQRGVPEKLEVVEAESISEDLPDETYPSIEFGHSALTELEEKMAADENQVISDEPTIVAKVEDIDILMQKLDQLSEKEMLSSLTSSSGQTKRGRLLKTDEGLDNLLAEITNVDAPEFTEGNGVSKDKTLLSLTGNILTSEIKETETKAKAPNTALSPEQKIIVKTAVSEQSAGFNETEALNVASVASIASSVEQLKVDKEEFAHKSSEKSVSNIERADSISQSELPPQIANAGVPVESKVQQNPQAVKIEAAALTHSNLDLTSTQPIDLAAIEKMSTQIEPNPFGSEQRAKSAANEAVAEPVVESVLSGETPGLTNVEPAAQSVPSKEMPEQANPETAVESALSGEATGLANAQSVPSKEMPEQVNLESALSGEAPGLANAELVSSKEMPEQANLAAAAEPAFNGETPEIANAKPALSGEMPELADITHFEHSFEQVFAQAALHTSELNMEQMLQTDELMNLHEEMKRVEAEKAQALASEEPPLDLEMGNQETNPLDFPDVYFINGGGSVSSSAYHATSTVNYAAYLDATTQENNQLSALVNTELHFSEIEQQEPQKVKTASASIKSFQGFEEKAEKIEANAAAKQMHGSGKTDRSNNAVKSSAIADVNMRKIAATKPLTFADTGTTLVDFATVAKETEKLTRSGSAAKSRAILDEDDLLAEQAIFEIKQEPQKATTEKTKNQILIIVIISLVLVIVALLSFIIFSTL